MDIELTKRLYDIHTKGFENAFCNVIKKEKYDVVYSNSIKTYYDNFVSNFNINNFDEFKKIIDEASKDLKNANRETIVYVFPFMKELYNNKEEYFDNKNFELVSKEEWQIFQDFDKLDYIKTNCKYNIKLELATDMEEYAKYMFEFFKSDESEDPYGEIDEGYGKEYANFQSHCKGINCNCYLIKANDEVVGVSQGVYNKDYYGIYGFAIKSNYRNKGIGKVSLKQQLEKCKEYGVKTAYLQTEAGFYPYEMYKKFGFKDLFSAYYYKKI